MNNFKSLRAALFIYECIRLAVLVGIFMFLQPYGGTFPVLVYAAPNALFLLMAVFLLIDPERYDPYAPLYLAGKCICLFSIVLWFIVSWAAYTAQLAGNPTVLRALLFMFIGEILSIVGGTALVKKGKRG
jgi:hypothetical protein